MNNPTRHAAQRGFTLIELSVALLIGLFLIGGLLTLVQAMKRTSTVQSGLSQLQDSERMAMQLITDVVQTTGYFPDPVNNTAATEFTPVGAFAQGQALYGTGMGIGLGDTIAVRFETSGSDNLIDCRGNVHNGPSKLLLTSVFGLDANGDLQCTLTVGANPATTFTLVSGLTNITILYGVQSNSASGNNSIDAYLNANLVNALNLWPEVYSVQVALTFTNPLYGTKNGQSTQVSPTITFRRVIDIMNKAGVNT